VKPVIRTWALDDVFIGVLAALILVGFVACRPVVPPPGAPTCPAACEHLRTLHCDIAAPTTRGGSCEQVCQLAQDNGADFAGCALRAQSCAATEDCEGR
jgi:hypothetical protein